MQGRDPERSAHVLVDRSGKPQAVFIHWSDAQDFAVANASRGLRFSDQPGLIDVIEHFIALPKIGSHDQKQEIEK